MFLKTPFEITGIGSMPHVSEKDACELVFSSFGRVPFWPQLVNKSFLEDMLAQFAERMPGIAVDTKKKKVYIDRKRNLKKEIDEFNRHYGLKEWDYFSFSDDHASGFYEFAYRLKSGGASGIDYLKGQITGPVSFSFSVFDETGVPLYFDKALMDTAVKALAARAGWQASKLKNIFPDVVIFIDEPSLTFFKHTAAGSKIKKHDIAALIDKAVAAVHAVGCYAGVHCCGDADWALVLSADIDILSFDAFNYGASFLEHTELILKFLDKGGIISWGIVPTAKDALAHDAGQLIDKLAGYVNLLSAMGIDRKKVIGASLITPSCGCGALSEEQAKAVGRICRECSTLAKDSIRP